MANLQWTVSDGAWNDAANWTASSQDGDVPRPGDALTVESGRPALTEDGQNLYGCYDNETVSLGGKASLELDGTKIGDNFRINASNGSGIDAEGAVLFNGSIASRKRGDVVDIRGPDDGSESLVFGSHAKFRGADNTRLRAHLGGNIVLETRQNGGRVTTFDSLSNDGNVTVFGTEVHVDHDLNGRGTWHVEQGAALAVEGSVPAGQTIDFAGRGGELIVEDAASFHGAVTAFGAGDFIDFARLSAKGAAVSYDAATNAIVVTGQAKDGTTETQTVGDVSFADGLPPQPGGLEVVDDGQGGALVQYAGAENWSLATAQMDGNAVSVKADIANRMFVPGTAKPIDGAGVKIGIISNEAEGEAMKEIVHSIAPGADIEVVDQGSGLAGMAHAVTQLQADHCGIIIDDVRCYSESPFSADTSLDKAISRFIDANGSYFTSAGNYRATEYYQESAAGSDLTLGHSAGSGDGPLTVRANVFDNGSQYLVVSGTDAKKGDAGSHPSELNLSWDAPWAGDDGNGAPEALRAVLVDQNGDIVSRSVQNSDLNDAGVDVKVASSTLSFPKRDGSTHTYRVVIYSPLTGEGSGIPFQITGVGGGVSIVDPFAGNGLGTSAGHAIQQGVNTVGATDYGNSPAYGRTPDFAENFSSYGSGPASSAASGKPDFVATDGSSETAEEFRPFFGTSAAAPTAGGVSTLMACADPYLTNTQVTALLERSAVKLTDTPDAQQGAGLIQADVAVQSAITAATTPIWTAQNGSTLWSDAGNWSNRAVPGAADPVSITDGDGQLTGAYTSTDDLANAAVASLVVDGGGTATPTLVVGQGCDLAVGSLTLGTGTVQVGGALDVAGDLAAGGGCGEVSLAAGASASVGGTFAAGQTVDLGAGQATLAFTTSDAATLASGLSGHIGGFTVGDTVDLAGLSFGSVAGIGTTGGSVTLSGADGSILAHLDVSSSSLCDFSLAQDGGGGTDVKFNDATAQTAQLYYGLLDRAPDSVGLQDNARQLAVTSSLPGLAQSFLDSSEYLSRYPNLSNAGFVDTLYQNALGRPPDPAGAAGWTGALDAGTSRADVAVGIAESPEAAQHLVGRFGTAAA